MTDADDGPDGPPWSCPIDVLVDHLRTDAVVGLDGDEAGRRLAVDGPNLVDETESVAWWLRLGRQFSDPIVVLLLVAIGISIGAWSADGGDGAPVDALVIAAIVVLNAGIGFWQELAAEEAVTALRHLSTTHATVVRDGLGTRIPTSDLVVGDVVELAEGDAVGADGRLVEAVGLRVSESTLTGESESVSKQSTARLLPDTPIGDRSNMVFRGTAVTHGRGLAVVVATGMRTEVGRIASMLGSSDEPTPLQQQMTWLGRRLGRVVVVLSAVVVATVVATSDDHSFGAFVDASLVGVSLAVAAVPEGLPAIMSVVLALGVRRMAGQNAIVKRLSSVETLGSATVICTDKTGTLTRSEMTVVTVATALGTVNVTGIGHDPVGHLEQDGVRVTDPDLERAVADVLSAGSLVNDARLRRDADGSWVVQGDPTEVAFLVAVSKIRDLPTLTRLAEIPFSSERRRMTTVHHDPDGERGGEFVLVMKGAPDEVLARCTHERVGSEVVPLDPERRARIGAVAERFGDDALRTIAVAELPLGELPADLDAAETHGLCHLGVVGILDPPRPEAAAAVAEAHGAGIRVIMVTGDHPRTAARIGADLGIVDVPEALAGSDLAAMDDEACSAALARYSVFARVAPEHKLRIVRRLRSDGAIVAMTGDGVNDAPALRHADIGVAMGRNGSEVAKESADMILADDHFATILRAVREGREIFSDIRKVLRFLLSSNGGEVLVMFVGVLAAGVIGLRDAGAEQAVPLLATQILWINLLTDGALAVALGVDPAVERVMDRPPRRPGDRVVDSEMLLHILVVSTVTAVVALVAIDLTLAGGLIPAWFGGSDVTTARTMAFSTVVLGQIGNAFNARSSRRSAFTRPFENRLLWLAVVPTLALQAAVVHTPWLQHAFGTASLDPSQWAVVVVLASTFVWSDEALKWWLRRRPDQVA